MTTPHCLKRNQNVSNITQNVEENEIPHKIFRVVSRFPATLHVILRKIDYNMSALSATTVTCHRVKEVNDYADTVSSYSQQLCEDEIFEKG